MTERAEQDIANRALDLLNKGEIDPNNTSSFDIDRAVLRNLDGALNETLRLSRWPRARAVESLPGRSLDGEDPRFAYEIQLPADCAIVWRVGFGVNEPLPGYHLRGHSPEIYWREEGDAWMRVAGQGAGAVRTHFKPPVWIEYGRRLEPAQLPEELAELAAACLAMRCMQKAALSTAQRAEVARAKREALRMAVLMVNDEQQRGDQGGSSWLAAMDGV